MRNKNPAIVLGGSMNGLGVIRNLGRNGVQVYCVVKQKDEAVHSRYCNDYFVVPRFGDNSAMMLSTLNQIAQRFSEPPVIFPTTDVHLLNLCNLRDQLGFCRLPISNREVVEKLVVKKKFYQSLASEQVPHPTTWFLEETKEVNSNLTFPIFVKPSVSQIFFRAFGKKGFVANSEGELHTYTKIAHEQGIDVMVQEIIPGPPTNHIFIDGYLDENSKPLALFARQRLRMWPLSFGNSTVCSSIPLSKVEDLRKTIVEYLQSIGFNGIFSAEFKKDPRDGVGKLLEVNARSWWYNSYPARCGVNIVYMAYLDAVGKEVQPIENYESGVKLIYLSDDFKASIRMFMKRSLTFRKWISQFNGKKEWAFFAKDDVQPCIMNFVYTMLSTRKKSLKTTLSPHT